MRNLDENEENVILKKFPGGTCDDLEWYSRRHLDKVRPYRFVVVCGTNDLPTRRGEIGCSDEEIAASLTNIGHLAKSYGVEQVCISSIMDRRGHYFRRRILNINRILQASCLQEGFKFLCNKDIFLDFHMDDGGLHLRIRYCYFENEYSKVF